MKRYILIIIILLSISVPKCKQSERQGASQSGSERLEQIVKKLQEESDIPGLSVAIARDGQETLVAASGFADLEKRIPVTPETRFFIGSVSKNLFAVMALKLADQGRLKLESPLSDYVPWPRGDEITVRMLMNHTSGIPDWLTGEWFQSNEDGGIPEKFRRSWTPVDIMAAMPDKTPAFDPGSGQDYSNTNGLLVGEVIRKVTGQYLVKTFEKVLSKPLELKDFVLYGESTTQESRARGYSAASYWGSTDGELVDCSAGDDALLDAADGSVIASAGDLLRYHQALRQGELLSESSWEAMHTVEQGIHNGLGYLIAQGPFGRVRGNLGRSMGHTAANLYYPDHETYVVILSNRSDVPLPLAPLLKQWFNLQED